MYTLKGIFPEPKKEQKRNYIKENMKQLKVVQSKSQKEPKYTNKSGPPSRLSNSTPTGGYLDQVKSSSYNKNGKATFAVGKTNSTFGKKHQDVRLKKGDMAEFLKRKEMRHSKPTNESQDDVQSSASSDTRDVGCQTVETNLAQKLAESTKLTMLYPHDDDSKVKASGDSDRNKGSPILHAPFKYGDDDVDTIRTKSKLNAILEKKNTKDPYLPSGYQKGVLPKYLRDRKEQDVKELEGVSYEDGCPSGHVPLPDNERKETLKMLRNSFAELINELNKLPVRTDTLRMRNRKMELEKQLAKLEEGIKVFSRPKVFVKIGE